MDDDFFMREAIAVGRSVAGKTGDNPPVGCVIVKDGDIVARGATQPPGGSHAEVMAIREAENSGYDIATCDFFVTLEPCTFQGRTPPCSTLLAGKRPRRVVIGIRDPHPRVMGAGIAELRAAGIEVVEGIQGESIAQILSSWVDRFSG